MKSKDVIYPSVVIQEFSADLDTVWSAITDHAKMVKWFFEEIPEFRAEVGFETQFSIYAGDKKFEHHWKIIEVESAKKIVYQWKYIGYEGEARVTFELQSQGIGTILIVSHCIVDEFSGDIPEFKAKNSLEGWQYLIIRLMNFLQ